MWTGCDRDLAGSPPPPPPTSAPGSLPQGASQCPLCSLAHLHFLPSQAHLLLADRTVLSLWDLGVFSWGCLHRCPVSLCPVL